MLCKKSHNAIRHKKNIILLSKRTLRVYKTIYHDKRIRLIKIRMKLLLKMFLSYLRLHLYRKEARRRYKRIIYVLKCLIHACRVL